MESPSDELEEGRYVHVLRSDCTDDMYSLGLRLSYSFTQGMHCSRRLKKTIAFVNKQGNLIWKYRFQREKLCMSIDDAVEAN